MPRIVAEKSDVVAAIAEVFREHGYEGASLSQITATTGFGKGSLYHFFPGGKEDMASHILAHIDHWFETEIFAPLRTGDAATAIARMMRSVETYFQSGNRICLVGAFALTGTRDRFATPIAGYFRRWISALEGALHRTGLNQPQASQRAETAVLAIQGALVLARALNDAAVFTRALHQIEADLLRRDPQS